MYPGINVRKINPKTCLRIGKLNNIKKYIKNELEIIITNS
jgi:hypothetical protein